MQTITLREKRLRWWVTGLFALFVAELLVLRGLDPRSMEGWQVGLWLVIPTIFTILFLLLTHAFWWRRARGFVGQISKVMFWIFSVAFAAIWFVIWARLVFGWH